MAAHPEHDTLQGYLDGTLSPADAAALEARLRSEPALADALVCLAHEDAVLREWASSSAAAQALAFAAEQPAPGRSGRRPRRIGLLVGLAAAVALAAVILARFPRSGEPERAQSVATLEDVQGEVLVVSADGRAEPAESGQSLFAGAEIQTGADNSSTVLRIQDSRLTLCSETRLTIGDGALPMLFVTEGIVNAEVTRKPLVLRSSLAELRGKDARFSFVSLPEGTFIETDAGQARLTRHSDGRSIDLKRGQSAAVKPGNLPLQTHAVPPRVLPRRTLAVGGGPVQGLYFDPDGSSLVTCTTDAIKRWNLASGKLAATVYAQKKRSLRVFSASLDGRLFAVPSDERQVKAIDALTGAEHMVQRDVRRAATLALAADGRTLAVSWAGKEGNEVRLYDIDLGMERLLHAGHAGPASCLVFSPRGTLLATAAADRSVRLWQTGTLEPVRTLPRLMFEPRCLVFSPDERWLAVGDRKGNISVFDVASGSQKHFLTGHLRDVVALAFAPDGRLLASVSTDGTARLWTTLAGRELASFKGHANAAVSVAFSQDGRLLATGGQDRKVLFWDVPTSLGETVPPGASD